MMTLDDIRPISTVRHNNDVMEIDQAERKLGTRFPLGYREFVSRFGEGLLGEWVKIYPPYRIIGGANCVSVWRERINEYWFWDGTEGVTKADVLASIIVGDTLGADELFFHPARPDHLYVLPHDYDTIYHAGEGLMPAIEWLLRSGVISDSIASNDFEPFNGRIS